MRELPSVDGELLTITGALGGLTSLASGYPQHREFLLGVKELLRQARSPKEKP